MANKCVKTGTYISCRTCKIPIYLEPKQIILGRKKYCSKTCLYKGDSYTKLFEKGHIDLVPKESRGHDEETKKKISLSGKGKHSGILAWNYKSDRTQLKDDSKDRGGQLHREWSRQVKNRDGWRCKFSNSDCSGLVVAHHILSWKEYKNLRYEVNNGITLCHFHHPRKRKDEISFAPFFSELIKSA